MKSLFELLEVEKEKPQYQIYCDMDGVLCNFDLGYEELTDMSTAKANSYSKSYNADSP